MPEATFAMRPGEIRYVEIACRHCGSPAVLPIDAPRSGAGHYASKRCLWCAAEFPLAYQEAIDSLLSGLRLRSREARLQGRLVVSRTELVGPSRPPSRSPV